MEPYKTIELALSRAYALKRQHYLRSLLEPNPEIKQKHVEAMETTDGEISNIIIDWNAVLVKDMINWEMRSNVTLDSFKSANALLKHSVTELEEAAESAAVIVRSLVRLEKVVSLITKIAAI
jgi:hypothetical protein